MEIRADGPIVVAVDDSPPASAAVDAAAALAARLRVPLRLVHVNGHNHAGEDRLDALAAGVRAQGIAVETERCEGRTSSALVAACTRVGASVLATGTHGRGPLERLVLGSVAEALLHDAPVPVMTVRATAGA
jgi:nucleotide-binding universal stress UspA family protein